MKAEELKQKLDFANMEEVLAYCLECKLSLSQITFEPLKLKLNQKVVEELILESDNLSFNREALFLLTNKSNVPKDMEDLKSINVLKMALLSNIKKDFLYNNNKYNYALKDAVINSNNVLKTQYLPLLTGIGTISELRNNANSINIMINDMKEHNLNIALNIKKYIDKICLENIILNERTLIRKQIWEEIISEKQEKPKVKF